VMASIPGVSPPRVPGVSWKLSTKKMLKSWGKYGEICKKNQLVVKSW
jgi:hypothetical protein